MPGPAPNPTKPYSKHRRLGARGLVVLPLEGCSLPAPKLPTGRKWSAAERRMWRELWSSPQAVQWDDSAALPVSMLVVYHSAVLAESASAWQAAEARYLSDKLGLTPQGMVALGWRIAEPGEQADVLPLRSTS